jgi:hypothetical protein
MACVRCGERRESRYSLLQIFLGEVCRIGHIYDLQISSTHVRGNTVNGLIHADHSRGRQQVFFFYTSDRIFPIHSNLPTAPAPTTMSATAKPLPDVQIRPFQKADLKEVSMLLGMASMEQLAVANRLGRILWKLR